MRLIKLFLFVLPAALLPRVMAATKTNMLICYGRLDPKSIKGYDCVVLESEHYTAGEVRLIKSQNEKVLAYISLGEVNANAKHYPLLRNYTLGKNSLWNSYYLNLNDDATQLILMKIIGDGIGQGYDGFFLDNLDNYTAFGKQSDQKENAVGLLRTIFEKYPEQTFIQNAGLELVPQTAAFIDGLVVESVATNYTFNDKRYKLRDDAGYEAFLKKLADIKNAYHIPITLVEYADTEDLRKAIEERLAPTGFDYFVANIDLQSVPRFKK